MRNVLIACFLVASGGSLPAWAGPLEIHLTAEITSIVDNGFDGNLSTYLSVGETISATWTIDGMATAPTVNNTSFPPGATLEEFITTFSGITQTLSASVGTTTATGPSGPLGPGNLTRIRTETYFDISPPGGPDEVSDYAQLRAQNLDVSLGGSTAATGFMTFTQEHTTQSFEGMCPDGGIACLFAGVAGEPGAIPWEDQRVGLFVNRWGTALAALQSISVVAVPEPATWTVLSASVLALVCRRRR